MNVVDLFAYVHRPLHHAGRNETENILMNDENKDFVLPDGSSFFVASIEGPAGWRKIWHKIFRCPTFWSWRPSFKCPDCGKKYRCYWDGSDAGGKINLCANCAGQYD